MTETTNPQPPVLVARCPKCRRELRLPPHKPPMDIMGCPSCGASMRVKS